MSVVTRWDTDHVSAMARVQDVSYSVSFGKCVANRRRILIVSALNSLFRFFFPMQLRVYQGEQFVRTRVRYIVASVLFVIVVGLALVG